jgi:hypothetical protein
MGTLETIILILSYIKHNPRSSADNIVQFINPDHKYNSLGFEQANTVIDILQGLVEDQLLEATEGDGIGDWTTYSLSEEASEFKWGFINNTGPYVDTATSTRVALSFVHLATRTEPALQTQMTFSRKQARQQLCQLIGALL